VEIDAHCCISLLESLIRSQTAELYFSVMDRNYKSKRGSKKRSNQTAGQQSVLEALTRRNVVYHSGRLVKIPSLETVHIIRVPAKLFGNGLTAGAMQVAQVVDPFVLVLGWATTWAAVFKQYFVVKAEVTYAITSTNLTATGNMGECWFQCTEDSSTPTSTMARQEHGTLMIPNVTAPYDSLSLTGYCTWTPRSSEDWQFQDTSSNKAWFYSALFADPTYTFSSTGDSATRVLTQIYFTLAFRYFR